MCVSWIRARSRLPISLLGTEYTRLHTRVGYFHYANSAQVFDKMQWQMRERVRRWLWKKHAKTETQYGNAYSNERLHDHYGLVNFPMKTKWQTS